VYMYGLSDLTTLSLANPRHHAKLLRFIQTALKSFEPRIYNIRLLDLGTPSRGGRVLRLRIEGTLRTDPLPESVSFDTVLELSSGHYEVEHAG
jgi:type VI secretion system protein ImpF